MTHRKRGQQTILDAERRLWPRELAFGEDVYAKRLTIVQGEMQTRGLAMVVLFDPETMFWLTGYQTIGYFTFQAMCVPQDGKPEVVTRTAAEARLPAIPTSPTLSATRARTATPESVRSRTTATRCRFRRSSPTRPPAEPSWPSTRNPFRESTRASGGW